MKKLTFILMAVMASSGVWAQVAVDQWALTDKFERKAAQYGEVRGKQDNKVVAMFYWTWHTDHHTDNPTFGNVSETLRKYPEALYDVNHPGWGSGVLSYFWDEPLFGYYRTTDKWVLRRHAEMLADAGVDVVFFDCTNGDLVWKSSYDVLMETWSQALKDGVKVPKISFLLPFGPWPQSYASIKFLYEDIYQPERYPELWFYWEGKPMLMGYGEAVPDDGNPLHKTLREFFTFRPSQPDYVDGPQRPDQWGWMESYPQHKFGERPDGSCEQVVVSVSQNATARTGGHAYAFNATNSYGRSYTGQKGQIVMPQSYLHGFNFQEQWDRALEIDPDVVWITGWNEFTAGKSDNWPPHDPHKPMAFPDQFDWERSRDIEPVKAWGQMGDIYYCQLVEQVRRFKGVGAPAEVSKEKSVKLDRMRDWDNVLPSYDHYRGNTFARGHKGYGDTYYENNTGRNDIVRAKVARDKDNVYFYVETDRAMTDPLTSRNWMTLYIDVDRSKDTGWEGYDFILNRTGIKKGATTLERSTTKYWGWETVGEVEYVLDGNKLAVKVPRAMLGLTASDLVNLEFKWNDNTQDPGNLIDFYVNGDTAPGGRFNFVYKAE